MYPEKVEARLGLAGTFHVVPTPVAPVNEPYFPVASTTTNGTPCL
jgi:hypothetical protein